MLEAYAAAEHADAEAAQSDSIPVPPPAVVGNRLGPYRIEREISHGGMGTVYMASRADQEFEQKVAIKVIRPGFNSEEVDRRFRNERQILAALEHPNIARLLDGGSTPEGQPYLVMEYIDGLDVLEYCHRHSLSLSQRLLLFLNVAAGVAHAHRHLVIHRDLKPGNILVTNEGEPKLLDFGIAKLVQADEDATSTGLSFFSPLYASPEQLNGDPVSTSTDVYSLGVVLYEMLVGERPYRLRTTSNAELVAAILLQEPERPGSRKSLPADLDAILLKALRKQPLERYGSVEQLAGDVERFLANRPVAARKGTRTYHARKFLQRHRLVIGAATLAVLALTGGVISTLVQARRAERRFQEVRQLANYLVHDFHSAVSKLPGSTQLQRDVVEHSMRYLDRLALESTGDPGLQTDLAEGYLKLGDVLGNPFQPNLGETAKAVVSYRKSMATADGVLAENRENTLAWRIAADARMKLGSTSSFGGSREEPLRLLRDAVAMHKKALAARPEDAEAQVKLARAMASLATALGQNSGFEVEQSHEVLNTLEALHEHLDAALRRHPGHAELLREKAAALNRRGTLSGSSDPRRAIGFFSDAIATLALVKGPMTEDVAFRRQRAALLLTLAWSEAQAGAYDDAIRHYDQGEEILRPIAAADPSNAAARYHLTAVHRGRGIACEYAGRFPCARDNFLQAAALHKTLIEKDPVSTVYPSLRGELLTRTARLEMKAGQQTAARAHALEGTQILVELASRPGAQRTQLVEACKALSSTPVPGVANPRKALEFCERATQLAGAGDYYALETLAHARYRAGDKPGAIAAAEKALAAVPAPQPGQPPSRARKSLEDALAAMRQGKRDQ